MSRWIEAAYERSPVVLQHVMISLYGWRLARLRYGGGYQKYLEELEKSQYLSEQELAEMQRERLRILIDHCYTNVPYYKRLFDNLKLTPADFRTTDDLAKLPILEKEAVRRQPEEFQAQNYRDLPYEVVSTSGSTGTTLRLRVDVEGRRKNYAFFSRLKSWAGIDPSARTATFAGRTIVPANTKRPPFWRYNFPSNTILFSSYHLSDANIPAYLDKLRDWKPELIDSYPSSVELLARYAMASGSPAPEPKAIITSSETLRDDQREIVTNVFRCRVFDQYGSAEQVCFISQCEAGSYHVHPEFGVTEFVPEDKPDPRSHFRIVATGFTNMAMPLLRYDMGDLAVPGGGACVCGRKFPTIERIIGRADDIIVTPDGRRVGRLDPVFKGLQTIRKAQIVQDALHTIRIRVVPGKNFRNADLDSVRHELGKRLGPDMEYTFELVEDIPVGAGGKFHAVVSRLNQGKHGSK
jgi:phenylacetate-CoA ligase